MTATTFWNAKHRTYRGKDWIRRPTLFAQEVIDRFPPSADVLDAGCGQGQDSVYFAAAGHRVTAVDHSDFALANFPPTAPHGGSPLHSPTFRIPSPTPRSTSCTPTSACITSTSPPRLGAS
ncbi:hypothetical protein GTV15_07120 [Streptomyces sp. SID7803]|nr:hypothetical protein [Streptomyces sp. SID7803]